MVEGKPNKTMVFHFRVPRPNQNSPSDVQACAGATVIFRPDLKRFGVALCCPKDRYSRVVGRQVAENHAVYAANRSSDIKSRQRKQQPPRFNHAPVYEGSTDLNDLRAAARALAYDCADRVHNPVYEYVSVDANDLAKLEELRRVNPNL